MGELPDVLGDAPVVIEHVPSDFGIELGEGEEELRAEAGTAFLYARASGRCRLGRGLLLTPRGGGRRCPRAADGATGWRGLHLLSRSEAKTC